MDAADLYGGLALPKQTKRERREAQESAKQREESAAKDGNVKRQRVERKPLDLPATVSKIEGYMLVDKKFAKASALFCQLISTQLTVESSGLFVNALTKVIDEKAGTLSGKKEFQTLIEALDSKRDVILSVDGDERLERECKLDAWKFLAITHAQLFTDETYQFNKAAKVVKTRFEEMVSSKQEQDEEKQAQRLHTELMPLLRTMYGKLNVAWATTIVEGVLALGTRHRLLFNDKDRVEVDSWTKGMQDRRSAPAVARSAGSDARRNIVVANGAKSSEAGAKVPGCFNHPLFNKEL
ncbi:39s ribosomal protein mitochondrial-like [Phytophthora cinnamomi]|uniref:39s ribosomal protein mitochondrial-like n=1 Tax=Phytophthora cinnamomi TaxID=4785 RepID=UPI00355A4489|nr:39s ribosomal protein mitochondrial-like [Phytophthora cinnamomi]